MISRVKDKFDNNNKLNESSNIWNVMNLWKQSNAGMKIKWQIISDAKLCHKIKYIRENGKSNKQDFSSCVRQHLYDQHTWSNSFFVLSSSWFHFMTQFNYQATHTHTHPATFDQTHPLISLFHRFIII